MVRHQVGVLPLPPQLLSLPHRVRQRVVLVRPIKTAQSRNARSVGQSGAVRAPVREQQEVQAGEGGKGG